MNKTDVGRLLGVEQVREQEPAKASPRQRLRGSARAEALLRAWHSMEPDGPDRADQARKLDPSSGNLFETALTHLVAGAAYRSEASPQEALRNLRQAEVLFRSLSLPGMCQATRVEAAWQVRQAGFPALALRSLESADALASPQFVHSVHALRALCQMDLGRLEAAARSVQEAAKALSDGAAGDSQRAWWYLRTASLQLQATQGLLKRDIACHLTEPLRGHAEAAAVFGQGAAPLGAAHDLTPIAQHPGSSILQEHKALAILVDAACSGSKPARVPGLMRLVAEFALQPELVGAQAWLWLGTALMALGKPKLATALLEHAVSAARSRGQSRVQRGALIDLVHAHEQAGLVKEALAALKELRRLEAELHEGAPPQPQGAALRSGWAGPDPSSVQSPHLVRALHLLENSEVHFTVDSLACACAVSRRTLEKVFRAELGQSVAECLRGRRLSLVQVRLSQSMDSIKKIALESGYPSSSALCHDFKRVTGLTPAHFRARKAASGGEAG